MDVAKRDNVFRLCGAFAAVSILMAVPGSASATDRDELQSQIQDISSSSPATTVAVYVIDATTSEVLTNLRGELPVQPASCNKLRTTAAAMSLLGEDFRFHTRVGYRGTIDAHTRILKGDLVVTGGGDPTISGRFAKNKRDVTAIFREWIKQLKSKVDKIDGNIVADDSLFDDEYFHPAWYGAERAEWYEAEVSALAFNDNCVDISWSSKGKLPGDLAAFRLNPETKYVQFSNEVKVAAKGRPVERYYKRGETDNKIAAVGTLGYDSAKDDSAAVHDGALYFATVFCETATSEGLKISGKPTHRRGAAADNGVTQLIDHPSPTLSEIIRVIDLNSQNFYAECVCKLLGKERGAAGSFAGGADVVEKFMRDNAIYNVGQEMVDGSGLSSKNRTTARQLVETIRFMDKGPHHEAWRAALPLGGTRGSLKSRFQETSETRALAPRIYGKTGLIGGVRSLAGIVTDAAGREMYYAIVLNGLDEHRPEQGMAQIDRVALLLADLQ